MPTPIFIFVIIVISQQAPRYSGGKWDSKNDSIAAPKKGGGKDEAETRDELQGGPAAVPNGGSARGTFV